MSAIIAVLATAAVVGLFLVIARWAARVGNRLHVTPFERNALAERARLLASSRREREWLNRVPEDIR